MADSPQNLGLQGGRLAPCPNSPNCVCSQDVSEGHAIEPLHFSEPAEAAWQRLQKVVERQPRTKTVTVTDQYLHVQFTSLMLRFVDDVEFLLDPATQVIHFRSASRTGHSDLGVNRRRMEKIRSEFENASR